MKVTQHQLSHSSGLAPRPPALCLQRTATHSPALGEEGDCPHSFTSSHAPDWLSILTPVNCLAGSARDCAGLSFQLLLAFGNPATCPEGIEWSLL